MSVRRRVPLEEGRAAVTAVRAGETARTTLATAVRYLLEQLAAEAEGGTVEVRVPPFGAAQAVAGPRHTRGTPPNVVETDPATWVAVATGALTWDAAVAEGRISASGTRASLAAHLPVRWDDA